MFKKMDFESLSVCYCGLVEIKSRNATICMYDPNLKCFDFDTVDGWIERYVDILESAQYKCIFRAVCEHCRPSGVYKNLFRYAKNFAEETVKEIFPSDIFFEIDPYYTKDHCPFVVEFKL